MLNWLHEHARWEHAWWFAAFSIGLGVVSALVGFVILMRLPEDHFLRAEDAPILPARSPIHLLLITLKNLLGIGIILAGGIMALPLVPGPGLILVVIGLSLTSFPGKQRLQLKLLRVPLALEAINWMRAKARRPPLQLPSASGRPV